MYIDLDYIFNFFILDIIIVFVDFHQLGRLKRLAERTYPSTTNWVLNFSKLKPCVKFLKSLNKRIELNKIHLYFIVFQKFRWTVKLILRKNSPFQRFRMNKSSIFYTAHLQLNKRFFSAGNSSHANYGQRGNWNFMERIIPKTLYTHYPR